MPHNPINNNPSFGPYDYHQVRPGTTEYVSHSFDERLTEAEFDDALIDQTWWKRQRYEGSKATAESINKYTDSKFVGVGSASIGDTFTVGDFTDWPGDITYQNYHQLKKFLQLYIFLIQLLEGQKILNMPL